MPAAPTKYDQTATWRRLAEIAIQRKALPPAPEVLVGEATARRSLVSVWPRQSIVHMVFDRNVVPLGGVLRDLTMTEGRTIVDAERLQAMGYVVSDGKVEMVDEAPIGQGFQVLDYWGGLKQHRRWHLAEPISLSPNRNGDPFFMDENMIGFGATWQDGERMEEAFFDLIELFLSGVNHKGCVAAPVVLDVFWR